MEHPAPHSHCASPIGYHVFKINPAVLMGGVAGAGSHSGILLTVFGYFAMILAQ
ncbi:hypothetical protein [Bradyrhizobium cajani]|uniref:Uncharacterized protein n=1 Tax=Bradyrhizobium cajani TaxID=1928661 RepID=A0A844TC24_9BRAD|nr:hypothetical protein [Bradyrhizobium cajani]MCP3369380.1 hypothetical protein [Bradyrhizobium cajani]MVT75105.1 hypothetical protein [Bradyrhizobium cajani]